MNDSVSIIIPVYNGEKYLKECLESCIIQTWPNFDIIVVDDGSTDQTANIIWEFAGKHRHITHIRKNNGGTGSALNAGIEASHGSWIKWLSADDKFATEDSLKLIMKNVSDVGYLYYTDYEVIDENGEFKRLFREPDRSEMSDEIQGAEMYWNFFGNGSTSIFHRTTVYRVGPFNETMPYNDDYEYWLRWILRYKYPLKHIPIITVQYREHSQSLTGTKKADENMKLVENLRRDYKQYLTDNQKQYLETKRLPFKRKLAKKLPAPVLRKIMGWKKR
jgi:glycosyltransferase involved in cell wall biosynthesis